jgi:hypothetical protein
MTTEPWLVVQLPPLVQVCHVIEGCVCADLLRLRNRRQECRQDQSIPVDLERNCGCHFDGLMLFGTDDRHFNASSRRPFYIFISCLRMLKDEKSSICRAR